MKRGKKRKRVLVKRIATKKKKKFFQKAKTWWSQSYAYELGEKWRKKIKIGLQKKPPVSSQKMKPHWKWKLNFFRRKQKVPKKRSGEKQPTEVKQESRNETKIDVLYRMICEEKELEIGRAAKELKVSEELILIWAKVLEDDELITIKYPPFGGPILKKYEKEMEEEI